MTIEQILLFVLGVTCTGLGWFANQMYHAIKDLQRDFSVFEVKVGTDYVRYDRLQDLLRPIADNVVEIKASMAHKVDKP